MRRALANVKNPNQKANTLTSCAYKGMGTNGMSNVLTIENESATKADNAYSLTASYGVLYRKLTPLECERLQTLPDNWTDCVSNTQRYKAIGNGWTIDVISHILKHI